ncbi:Na+/H+ antiporter subunit D [Halobacteriales archaeon QS_5_70_17]|nr:MAG: Na+/H+ antiporter subunit D [Halobacteriales archaeon QS_5_70_17]
MNQIVIAPLLVAVVAVVATLALGRRPALQRATSVAGAIVYAASVALLAWRVVLAPDAGPATYQSGGWPAPFGITLVADALSAFMLVLAATVGLWSVAVAVRVLDRENQRVFYHPLFHCMLLGVTGAFLTGDLFNLFVWFEVMLMASYVFVAFYGGAKHTAGAFRYLVPNVVGSAVMLLGIGGLYATVGTLNMADMARRLADPAAYGIDVAPVVGLSAFVLATFALKAGLVPFQFWVPSAYRAAPLPAAAMLAGVTKKVGIYAVIRLYFTVFAAAGLDGATLPGTGVGITGDSPLAFLGPVLLAMAVASIAVGGVGAVGRETVDELLAYSSIGQVGFIALPVALAASAPSGAVRRAAVAAALVYALHHALAKGLLFLSTATVRGATGTTRLSELGGLGQRSPVLSAAFLVGSLSLVGIPPLAGFFGKFLVFEVAARHFATVPTAAAAVPLAAALVGAVLTIVYITRTWIGGFWGTQTPQVGQATVDPVQVGLLAALAAVILAAGVAFDPVYRFATAAAEAALDRGAYVDLVDPAPGTTLLAAGTGAGGALGSSGGAARPDRAGERGAGTENGNRPADGGEGT